MFQLNFARPQVLYVVAFIRQKQNNNKYSTQIAIVAELRIRYPKPLYKHKSNHIIPPPARGIMKTFVLGPMQMTSLYEEKQQTMM